MLKYLILSLSLIVFSSQPGLTAEPSGQLEKSLEFMTGQMLIVGFRGTTIKDSQAIIKDIKERYLGGIVLFNRDLGTSTVRNVVSPKQLQLLIEGLQKIAPEVLFVAIDQEGGQVARLRPEAGFKGYPSAARLGKGKVQDTYNIGLDMGKRLASLGINVNFAPSLDVNVNPKSPAIAKFERSFNANPELVSQHGIAFAKGLNTAGVMATFKHFPGHGSATSDSHYGLSDVSATWTEVELIPFKAAFKEGLNAMLMTGHLFNSKLDPDYPATLSSLTLHKLLRQELGYQGLIVSDDMQMSAITKQYGLKDGIIKAVLAGVDLLVFGNNMPGVYDQNIMRKVQDILLNAVKDGMIPQSRIEESWQRIKQVKAQFKPEAWD